MIEVRHSTDAILSGKLNTSNFGRAVRTIYRGLFWLVENDILVAFKTACNTDGQPDDPQLPYNSRKGDSFTHKATWKEAAHNQPRGIRSKAWNYYPRGRVEIRSGKITVYHNPMLADPAFEQRIIDEFELLGHSVRFVPDYSRHYKEGAE